VRAFIDLVVERVAGNAAFFLEAHELGAAKRRRSAKHG
jgi:hypothetical protein